MVTPGAERKVKATPEKVADYTLKLLRKRIPPSVPGIYSIWYAFTCLEDALLVRAKALSLAQLGKYTGEGESEEAKQGMFVKGYSY